MGPVPFLIALYSCFLIERNEIYDYKVEALLIWLLLLPLLLLVCGINIVSQSVKCAGLIRSSERHSMCAITYLASQIQKHWMHPKMAQRYLDQESDHQDIQG